MIGTLAAGEYSGTGKYGRNTDNRPELLRMLADIGDGKYNVPFVLARKLSRFGRNAADVLGSSHQHVYGKNASNSTFLSPLMGGRHRGLVGTAISPLRRWCLLGMLGKRGKNA